MYKALRKWPRAALASLPLLALSSVALAQTDVSLRLMPLGDSITAGYEAITPPPDENGYRGPLFTALSGQVGMVDFVGSQNDGTMADPDNEGHYGYYINQIANLIKGELKAYRPNIVTLHIGTNDLNATHEVSTAPLRLAALIDEIMAAEPDATLLVAQLIPSSKASTEANIESYNAQIPAIVQARASKGEHVAVVSMSSVTTADLTDDIHPNDTGYQKMAVAWDGAVQQAIAAGWITYPVAGSLSHPTGQINSGLSGQCLEDPGDSATVRTQVDLAACSTDPSQQWNVNSGQVIINNNCLDVTGQATASGSPVEIFSCNGGANQVWEYRGAALYNPISGNCLEEPTPDAIAGMQLHIATCNGSANQRWRLPVSGPVVSGIAGKCLDYLGGAGTEVDLYGCNQTAAQQWQVSDNLLRISGLCLEVTGGSATDGTPVQLAQCTGGSSQVWVPQETSFVNPASGKCLDDPDASTADRTLLDISKCTRAANQIWRAPAYGTRPPRAAPASLITGTFTPH